MFSLRYYIRKTGHRNVVSLLLVINFNFFSRDSNQFLDSSKILARETLHYRQCRYVSSRQSMLWHLNVGYATISLLPFKTSIWKYPTKHCKDHFYKIHFLNYH